MAYGLFIPSPLGENMAETKNIMLYYYRLTVVKISLRKGDK